MATRRSTRLAALAKTIPEDALGLGASSETKPESTAARKRKASNSVSQEIESSTAPSTPTRKRAPKKLKQPPATPTPQAASLLGEAAVGTTPKPKSRAVARLADPEGTNATLLSPSSSKVVASESVDAVSPSKSPAIQITTENLLQMACDHLVQVEPRIKQLIDKHPCHLFSPEGLAEKIDPFESLCSGIISQQVSGAAARSIKAKFIALFDESSKAKFPRPVQIVQCSLERLRTAGLSQRKAEYIHGLAQKFADGELSAKMLADAPYEEVLEKLTAVRGLGQWSVEMFACFGLKRMDVFSLGDLGVQRGMAAFVGRDVNKLRNKGGKWKYMTEKEMSDISSKFAPYRSLFMWYMWRVEETDVSTMERAIPAA